MGLFLTLAYIAYMYGSPAHWNPWMLQVPMQMITSSLATLGSLPRMLARPRLSATPQVALFLVLFGLTAFSWLRQGWLGGMPIVLSEQLPALVLMFLLRLHCDKGIWRKTVTFVFAATLLLMLFIAVRELKSNPNDSAFVMRDGFEDTEEGVSSRQLTIRIRALGLIGDPNDFAQALLIAVAMSGLWWGRNVVVNLLLVIGPAAAMLYGVYLTQSRGALVALGAMVVVFVRRRLNWLTSMLIGVVVVSGLAINRFAGGREVSLASGQDRLAIWSEGIQLFKHSPLFGIGYRGFADSVGMTAHNSALLVAVELGITGLLVWVAIFVVSLMQLNRIICPADGVAPDPELKRDARAMEVAVAAYLGTSWFLSRVYHPNPFLICGIVAALAMEHMRRYPERSLLPPTKVWVRWSAIWAVTSVILIYLTVRLR